MYGYKVPLDKQDDPETILAYWLENAVPNDPQIYSYLVDRYGVQVYRLAFILLDKYQVQDEQDIKEIASRAFSLAAEAMYQASTDLDSFRGATSVSSWLFARTYRISRYRWVRRGLSRNSFTGDEIFIDLTESDATLQLKAEEERLIEALYKLPRHLSLVVLLRECLHLTVEEIAYVLGRRIIKIEKVLSRGRSELRRAQARTDAPAGDIRRIIKKYIDFALAVTFSNRDARLFPTANGSTPTQNHRALSRNYGETGRTSGCRFSGVACSHDSLVIYERRCSPGEAAIPDNP